MRSIMDASLRRWPTDALIDQALQMSSEPLTRSGHLEQEGYEERCALSKPSCLSLVPVVAVVPVGGGGDCLVLLSDLEAGEVSVLVELHLGGVFDDLHVPVGEGLV